MIGTVSGVTGGTGGAGGAGGPGGGAVKGISGKLASKISFYLPRHYVSSINMVAFRKTNIV